MDALLAFKMVPDLDLVTGEMVEGESTAVDTGYLRPIINPDDEGALELALQLRDQAEAAGATLPLSAVSVGGPAADRVLKTLMALRFARAMRLATAEDLTFRPDMVARDLADRVRQGGHRLLILGRQSSDGASGLVPPLVAASLGWPLIADVIDLSYRTDAALMVTCRRPDGVLRLTLRPPAVLAIADVAASYLRSPTLKDRMTHGKRPIEVIDVAEPVANNAGIAPLQPLPIGYSSSVERRSAVMVDGSDVAAALSALSAAWRGRGRAGP
ncbi:MAG: hypothetical protein P4L82_08705 [Ancalomicrobiaceae bacterium]|nr:hypothetical protein [Ancalomicrobiaceae bacterium]